MYIHYTLNTTQYTLNTTQYTVNTYRLTGLLDGISAGAFFDFFVFSPFTAVALSVARDTHIHQSHYSFILMCHIILM